MVIPLYLYRGKGSCYLWTNENLKCDLCNNPLVFGNTVIVCRYYCRGRTGERVFCPGCVGKQKSKHRPFGGIGTLSSIPALFVEVVPKGAPLIPLYNSPYDTSASKSTISAARAPTIPGETILDRTQLAGRETWEGAAIGAPDTMLNIAEKDRPLSLPEVSAHLKALQSAKTAITAPVEKKQLPPPKKKPKPKKKKKKQKKKKVR